MDTGAGQDPDPAAVDRVRRDLAALGGDEESAPDVPPAVTARVVAALRAQRGPGHSIRPPPRRIRVIGLVIGLAAVAVGVVIGGLMLARDPAPRWQAGPTAESITVSRPPPHLPLSDPQLRTLLTRSPEFGPLADPLRRASCIDGLGYSAVTQVLGAQPVDMHGQPAVLMLLPGDTPERMVALVVDANCSSAHTGLLANKVVTRP
jgi:hypothetical protein